MGQPFRCNKRSTKTSESVLKSLIQVLHMHALPLYSGGNKSINPFGTFASIHQQGLSLWAIQLLLDLQKGHIFSLIMFDIFLNLNLSQVYILTTIKDIFKSTSHYERTHLLVCHYVHRYVRQNNLSGLVTN